MRSGSAATTGILVFYTNKFWFASSCYFGEQDIQLSTIALGTKDLSNYSQQSEGLAPFILAKFVKTIPIAETHANNIRD